MGLLTILCMRYTLSILYCFSIHSYRLDCFLIWVQVKNWSRSEFVTMLHVSWISVALVYQHCGVGYIWLGCSLLRSIVQVLYNVVFLVSLLEGVVSLSAIYQDIQLGELHLGGQYWCNFLLTNRDTHSSYGCLTPCTIYMCRLGVCDYSLWVPAFLMFYFSSTLSIAHDS